jgi:enamine deaminase RidA (YjgF/YER057c/UK114 family)
MKQKALMNEAWLAWIDTKNPPTRACVAVELGTPETLVEIVVTAAK